MYGLGIKTNVNKSVGKNETTTLSLYQQPLFVLPQNNSHPSVNLALHMFVRSLTVLY